MAATDELFDIKDIKIKMLWDHAVATAFACEQLARYLNLAEIDEAFIAGMFHDVGKLTIYHQYPEIYTEVVEEAHSRNRRILEIEHEKFLNFDHVSVGGLVIKKWELSESAAESARFHHRVEKEIPIFINNVDLVCLSSLANVIVNHLGLGLPFCSLEEIENMPSAGHLQLTTDRIREFVDMFNESYISKTCAASEDDQ
jgi:putative nucleotidyltransferase with HDIG domain